MTVQKRLFWSNILMILVPVIAAALIGVLCVGIIWLSFIDGAGLDLHDAKDFNRVCLAGSETIEHLLEEGKDLSSLDALLSGNGMTAQILCGEEVIYSYGNTDEEDAALISAVEALSGDVSVSQNGRSLYKTYEIIRGETYTVYLLGGNSNETSYRNLKAALAVSAVLIGVTIFFSILLTNRFLTKFVFQRIEQPLDILTNSVHEIRDGNLDCHIDYSHQDEFLPICEDFNEMAARLKESVTRSQMQEKSRKELLAGISHDIRSPLTSIQAYVEGLLDGVARTPEAQSRYLTTIKTKAEDLDRIVSQLFLFSKMELGEYPDNLCRLRLDEKISGIIAELESEYAEKGMRIETNLTPVIITADPIQIERMVKNILENSLKYKTKTIGKVCLTLVRSSNACTLSFADDGPGVSENALPHLFEVFYRSDPARQNPQKGSGLGLAIVDSIVQHLGGSIAANKSEMGGLEIRVNLPCEEA